MTMTTLIITAEQMREAAAKIVEPVGPRPCDCERCECNNTYTAQAVVVWDVAKCDADRIRAIPIAARMVQGFEGGQFTLADSLALKSGPLFVDDHPTPDLYIKDQKWWEPYMEINSKWRPSERDPVAPICGAEQTRDALASCAGAIGNGAFASPEPTARELTEIIALGKEDERSGRQ